MLKMRHALAVGWVFLLLGTTPSHARSVPDHEGVARLEILAASTNAVVYQFMVSRTDGWIIESADPIEKRTRWSLRTGTKAARVASPLERSVAIVLSSRFLQLDMETGQTNAVIDFRQLQWPRHALHPLLEDFNTWANTAERTPDARAENEAERRRLDEIIWSAQYEYQVPLFTTNRLLVFRESTQREPFFRDWVLLRPSESDKPMASGDGGPLAILSDSFLCGHPLLCELAACPLDGSATNAVPLVIPRGFGYWTFNPPRMDLDYWPINRSHLACSQPFKQAFRLIYDERSREMTKIVPSTDLQTGTDWVPASSWLIRHTEAEAQAHVFEVLTPDGQLIASRIIPDANDVSFYRFRGLTAENDALFVEYSPATMPGEPGGERLRSFVLSLPSGELKALHTLEGPATASDVSFGLPHDGLVVAAFGVRPYIKKFDAAPMPNGFWIQAFDIGTGKVVWSHYVPVMIDRR